MTPKQRRDAEMLAGRRAIARADNVKYIEKLCRARRIHVEHDMNDSVRIQILGPKEPVSFSQPVLATIMEAGNDFPSRTLITQLRLVLE